MVKFRHRFSLYLLAFFLILVPPGLLYLAAQSNTLGLVYALLATVILGNLLAILVD